MTSRHLHLHAGLASSSLISNELHEATRAAFHATRIGGHTLEGLRLARRSMMLAKVENNAPAIIEAQNLLAICQAANGDFMESIASSIDVFYAAKELQDRLAMAHAMTTLAGSSSVILETPDLSLQMLEECLKFALSCKNVALEARVRNLRGLSFAILGQHSESEIEFMRIEALVPLAGEHMPRAMAAANHAHVAIRHACDNGKNAYDAIVQYARLLSDTALEVATLDGNRMAESIVRFDRGELFASLGEYAEAVAEFNRAMLFANAAKQSARVAKIHFEIAKIRVLENNLTAAIAQYDTALSAAEVHRPLRLVSRICEAKSMLQRKLGLFKRADALQHMADKEAVTFLRESEQARRALTEFWHNFSSAMGFNAPT